MLQITQQEVEIYRNIYYEHVKPMIKGGCTLDEIDEVLISITDQYGWTIQKYREFQFIDLLQRIEHLKEVERLSGRPLRINVMNGEEEVSTAKAYDFPELRCPIRSEEKRNLN